MYWTPIFHVSPNDIFRKVEQSFHDHPKKEEVKKIWKPYGTNMAQTLEETQPGHHLLPQVETTPDQPPHKLPKQRNPAPSYSSDFIPQDVFTKTTPSDVNVSD